MKTVWIRADASSSIGAGHITRCIALAEELREAGVSARFICRKLEGDLVAFINKHGFVAETISGDPADWTLLEDASKTCDIISKYGGKADWVIVDLPENSLEMDSALRSVTQNILAIDDHADRKRDCDIIVNPHFFPPAEQKYKTLTPPDCVTLAGLRHALVRSEFRRARQKGLDKRDNEVKRILVSFGGSDCAGLPDKVIEALLPLGAKGVEVDMIISSGYRDSKNSASYDGVNIRFHNFVEDMVNITAKADIVIGAYGVSTAERMLLGAPSIIITISESQVALAKILAEAGYAVYLGSGHDVTPDKIASAVNRLKDDPYTLRSISRTIMERVDGLGARRVVKQMGFEN
ncbi:MAG TPA: UDP-2,4-diacetamido-2,4,6-trideoxy-beta-L-altropyranose hydrolase [Nitrospirae bacterium]|nr:UDP-2,4-diacetamido-2,4,6-trideoxy-beta-L-altropyranose hydrolase [Nitrospirota bacterium]